MKPSDFLTRDDQILCGLKLLAGDPPSPVAATAISEFLLTSHGIHIHWRTIEFVLRKAKALCKASKRSRRWVFSPLGACAQHLSGSTTDILLVDPSKAVSFTARLHDELAALSGAICLCDPYLDLTTLQHLDAIQTGTRVRFLTFKVTDTGTTRILAFAFRAKGVTLEIRIAHANVLHDRYLLAGQQVLILGTSVNGFGKKQCFVIRGGQSIAGALLKAFDDLWSKGTPWP